MSCMQPLLVQACKQKVTIIIILLSWGWSSPRVGECTQVIWKLGAENKLEPRLLHILALTAPVPLLMSCRLEYFPCWKLPSKHVVVWICCYWALCAGVSHVTVYTKSSCDFELCPLFLSAFSTNLFHLPITSWLLHPDSQTPYSICYSGRYISTCFWQVIKSSWE